MTTDFIEVFQAKDDALCNDLIAYFHRGDTFDGMTMGGVNKAIKDSTDCLLLDNALLARFCDELRLATEQYIAMYERTQVGVEWSMYDSPQIQKYEPGQAYYGWHCERPTPYGPAGKRFLTFIMYLNDVPDGGTEFLYQKRIVEAKRGAFAIFPVEWTHTHRGVCSTTTEKYIITGWLSFR